MIHRLQRGVVPDKHHTALRIEGELAFEHCFTRRGFESSYTILYHRRPPHWVREEEELAARAGPVGTSWDGALRRRHFRTPELAQGGTPFIARRLLLANEDLGLWVSRPVADDPSLVANADGDELTFVHEGSGRVDSPLGSLRFEAGDYVYVPRALPHRWRLDGPAFMFVIEGRSWIDIPEQFRNPAGQLRMDAPYSHRDFREPEWPGAGRSSLPTPWEIVVQSNGRLTRMELANDPFDVVGWDGQVWPFAFPIRAFQPRTGLVHLPPTAHLTFAGGGFVVCSFVPRLVDTHEQAIPCPYPHSSVDCDEVLFYVDGAFTSRKGIARASVTLHPVGLPHGPHPGRYEASIGTRRTDELAVMVDAFTPLLPTDDARSVEDGGYNRSWVAMAGTGGTEDPVAW